MKNAQHYRKYYFQILYEIKIYVYLAEAQFLNLECFQTCLRENNAVFQFLFYFM